MLEGLLQYGLDNFGSDPTAMLGAMGAFVIIMIIVMLFVFLLNYVYFSLTLMKVAQKTKTEPIWLAWIPIANMVLKAKIAKKPWWPVLLVIPMVISYPFLILVNKTIVQIIAGIFYLIPGLLFTIYFYIWEFNICKARKRPGWWALVPLVILVFVPFLMIPVIGMILLIPYYLVAMAVGIWRYVMWGILAWGK